ncbi:MAG: hypothetical protein IJG57_00050 [Firmicutes bacterium]|nr:hypothetical protein [Bacillota bacterium]
MKKRVFCLILAAMFLQAMAGCGNAAGGGEEPADETAAQTEQAETPQDQSGSADSGLKTLDYSVKTDYQGQWNDDYSMQTVSCEYDQIYLADESQKALNGLNSALTAYNEQVEKESKEEYSRLQKQFEEFLGQNSKPDVMYTLKNRIYMVRGDDAAASILRVTDEYGGGPHPFTIFSAVSYDSQTGQKLKLEDVITDTGRFQELIEDRLVNGYPELKGDLETEGLMEEMTWTLGYQGIDVWYSAGSLASYAAGPLYAQILFSEDRKLFNEKYASAPAAYTIPMSDSLPLYYDLEGKGEAVQIDAGGQGYQDDYYEKVVVTCGKDSAGSEAWAYEVRPMLIHTKDGKNYIYAETTSDNDYRTLFTYEIGKDHVKETGELSGTGLAFGKDYMNRIMITDPENFSLETRINALSTYAGRQKCHVGKDGVPVPEHDYYDILFPAELIMKTDMEFSTLDKNLKESGKTVVPKGSVLTFLRTDGKSWVDFQVKNDDAAYQVRVHYDDSGWPVMVNGQDAETIFDGMIYAG